jgi:hypothetical protein
MPARLLEERRSVPRELDILETIVEASRAT